MDTTKVVCTILLCVVCAKGETQKDGRVSCGQLLAWSAAGIRASRIERLVRERQTSLSADSAATKILIDSGATTGTLPQIQRPTSVKTVGSGCPERLGAAAEFVQQHNFVEAEPLLRAAIVEDPLNPDLHLALGFVRNQQNDVDQAFDEFARAKELEPGFPEIHNGLAEVFYRSEDGDSTIAEARTALSIDPKNAEGYRYLGLGLFLNEKPGAALHAFEESLVRDPDNAETYYGIAITQRSTANLTAAVQAFRKALALNPNFDRAEQGLKSSLEEQRAGDHVIATKDALESGSAGLDPTSPSRH